MREALLEKIREEQHNTQLAARAFDMLEEVAFEMCGDVIPRKCFESGSRAMERFKDWYSSLPLEDVIMLQKKRIDEWVNFTQTQLDILEKEAEEFYKN